MQDLETLRLNREKLFAAEGEPLDVEALLGLGAQAMSDRAEPLFRIAMHYQSTKEFHTARGFFEWARKIPRPGPTRLFVDRAIYDYLLDLEYAVCLYYVGDHAEAIAVNDRLLARGTLPAHLVDLVVKNRQFGIDAIAAANRFVVPTAPESNSSLSSGPVDVEIARSLIA